MIKKVYSLLQIYPISLLFPVMRRMFRLISSWIDNKRLTQYGYKLEYNHPYFVLKDKEESYCFQSNPTEEIEFAVKGYLMPMSELEGKCVVDAGAFPGVTTFVLSKAVGDNGCVVAIEPDPWNYEVLRWTVEKNNLKNVIVLNKGLWSQKKIIPFSSGLKLQSRFNAGNDTLYRISKTINIETVTIDGLKELLRLKRIDFIKMDIEGAEIEAISGAQKTLKESQPILSIATYHTVNGLQTWEYIGPFLKEYGYHTITGIPVSLPLVETNLLTIATSAPIPRQNMQSIRG